MKKIKIKDKYQKEIGSILLIKEDFIQIGILLLLPYIADITKFSYPLNVEESDIISDIFKNKNMVQIDYVLLTQE